MGYKHIRMARRLYRLSMGRKKEYRLSIDYDPDKEEIERLSEVLEQEITTNVWFDTGDEVLQLPSEVLKYIEDSNGVLGIA